MIYFRITLHININVLPCIAFSLNYVIACEVNLLVDIMVKLKCTFGDTNCNFETQELEFGQSKELLETHLQFAHPRGALEVIMTENLKSSPDQTSSWTVQQKNGLNFL